MVLAFFASLPGFWYLGPQFFYVLQDHVAVSIESFYPTEKLSIIPAAD